MLKCYYTIIKILAKYNYYGYIYTCIYIKIKYVVKILLPGFAGQIVFCSIFHVVIS